MIWVGAYLLVGLIVGRVRLVRENVAPRDRAWVTGITTVAWPLVLVVWAASQ